MANLLSTFSKPEHHRCNAGSSSFTWIPNLLVTVKDSLLKIKKPVKLLHNYISGAYLPWHFLAYFCCGFPVLFIVSMCLMPETPAWLMAHKKEEKSEAAIKWLRGGLEDDIR